MTARPNIENPPMQGVPLLDLKAQYAPIEAEIMAALHHVCASQKFILGAHVDELEGRVAEYSHCRFGVGVSSGTDALLVALMALDVGLGDEVIERSFTENLVGIKEDDAKENREVLERLERLDPGH